MAQGKIIHVPYGAAKNALADERAPPVASPPRSPYGKYKTASGPSRLKSKAEKKAEKRARAIARAKERVTQAEKKKNESEALLKTVPKLDAHGRFVD